jgi:photosynthetic reaction center cytochrome c subunit
VNRLSLNRGWLFVLLLCSTGALIVAPLIGATHVVRQGTSGGQSAADEKVVIPPGKENLPAEEVFHNIEILKGKPASRLPGMMTALNGLLGVKCAYCHDVNAWEKEVPAKITSRHMFAMLRSTNTKYFSGENPNPITCWTCHRGAAKPTSGQQEIMAGLQSLPQDRRKVIDDLTASLGENKDKPAEEVFHNIQFFKGIPAWRLLRIMSVYTVALGVDCSHCHVIGAWEKDDKPAKRTVITMNHVVQDVNAQLFGDQPAKVACYTCHRGAEKPVNIPK